MALLLNSGITVGFPMEETCWIELLIMFLKTKVLTWCVNTLILMEIGTCGNYNLISVLIILIVSELFHLLKFLKILTSWRGEEQQMENKVLV